MTKKHTLSAQTRDVIGKEVRFLRRQGLTPIVLYRGGQAALNLQVATHELEQLMSKSAQDTQIMLQVEGEAKPRRARFQEIQRHVTRLSPIHVDFLQLD